MRLAILDQLSMSLEELLIAQKNLANTAAWKTVITKRKKSEHFRDYWNNRLYARWGLEWLQERADAHALSQLRLAIPAYNDAVKAMRREHKVTPYPIYLVRAVDEPYYTPSHVFKGESNPSFAERVQKIPVSHRIYFYLEQIESDFSSGDGRVISAVDIEVGERPPRVPYCGFCGELFDRNKNNENKFLYRAYQFIGMGRSRLDEFVCGENDCVKMGVADYIRLLQYKEHINTRMLSVISKMMGREVPLTPTQANYLREQALERLTKLSWRGN